MGELVRKRAGKAGVLLLGMLFFMGLYQTEVNAAGMAPSSVEYQGNTIISTYNCNLEAWQGGVGTNEQLGTYQLDLTGVDRIVAEKRTGHNKCGNCNGSSGHTNSSMRVGNIYGTDGKTTIELSNMAGYGMRLTNVTVSASATIHNTCDRCGGSSTEYCIIKSIRTYATPSGISAQPADCTIATGEAGSITTAGYKVSEYVWQKKEGEAYVTLEDSALDNGMSYGGTKTNKLDITAARFSANQTVYRCVMKGIDGKEWITRDAVLTVQDNTMPNAVIEMTPKTWTNGAVTLSATAEDIDSGLHETPYSWDGGLSYTDRNTQAFFLNGNYAVAVRDAAGNVQTQTVEIAQIDKTVPKLSVSANSVEKTTSPVKLYLTAEDNESGLHAIPYYYQHTWHIEKEFEADKNGSYEIMARDAAGNITNVCYEVTNIEAVKKPDSTDGGSGGNDGGGGNDGDGGGNGDGGGSGGNDGNGGNNPSKETDEQNLPTAVVLPILNTTAAQSKKEGRQQKEADNKQEDIKVELEKAKEEKEDKDAKLEYKEASNEQSASQGQDVSEEPALQPQESNKNQWLPALLMGVAGLLIFALLLLILFFCVWIETETPEKGFRLRAVSILYLKERRWNIKMSDVWSESDAARLNFGVLFLLLFEGWQLHILIKGETERELEVEISPKQIIEKKRGGGRWQ